MYVDDILASKDGQNLVENVVDIDRGLPTEGVLTLYIESMSNLSGVYSALEGIMRDVFDPAQSFQDSKYNISLFLEIKEYHKKNTPTDPTEEKSVPILDPYTVEIDNANVESKLHCFRFIEKHISRNHIINNWKHLPLQLTEDKMETLSESILVISLLLECSPVVGGGKTSRKLCGQSQLALEGILSAPNQDGCKETVGLVSEAREIICYLNCTMNYSKGGFERGNYMVEELKTDIKQKAEDLRHNRIFFRLTELVLLKHREFSELKTQQSKLRGNQKTTTYTLKVMLGKSDIKSLELKVPDSFGDLFKLQLEGHNNMSDFTICLDLNEIDRYITDKSMLEKFLNSKAGTHNFQALPPFSVELFETEESVIIKEMGKFEFSLIDLLGTKDKWESKGLFSSKALVPLLCATGGVSKSPSHAARLGLDIIILKTNKIKNKHTLEDLGKILANPRLRSLKMNQQIMLSMPTASYIESPSSFDVPSVTKLLKFEFKFSNSEITEIIDLLGKLPDSNEVDFYKIITSPLMYPVAKMAEEAHNLGMNYDEMIRVY